MYGIVAAGALCMRLADISGHEHAINADDCLYMHRHRERGARVLAAETALHEEQQCTPGPHSLQRGIGDEHIRRLGRPRS